MLWMLLLSMTLVPVLVIESLMMVLLLL